MNFDTKPPSAPDSGSGKMDPKMVEFVQTAQAQQQIMERIDKVTETCWDTCDIDPKDKLSSRQETCLRNCAARYFDVAEFVMNRTLQKAQQLGGGMS